jgi:glycine dehydrogenase subunit 2
VTGRRFRQADWSEPLIFEIGFEGRIGFKVPVPEPDVKIDVNKLVPTGISRETSPGLPEVSEIQVLRHYIHLSQMNYGVNSGIIYPLGSCTMKYNPIINEVLAGNVNITEAHPNQELSTVQGLLEFLYKFKQMYLNITGMDDATLQPAAGAHGEWTGIMLIRAYHEERGELSKRTEIIIPDSAHGTNPASAAVAGFKIVEVPSGPDGCVNLEALKAVVGPQTAGLMLTNPNTLGIFDYQIAEISKIIHDAGGLMYYDGANLNAIMGKCRPGDMGFDVVHVNLHKTFSTPHGGGGPGSGPVGCKSFLSKYLPIPDIEKHGGMYTLTYNHPKSIGKVHGFMGNINVILKAYIYALSMGGAGLKESSEYAVLNTNYIAKKLMGVKGLTLPFAPEKPRKHEVVFSAAKMSEETGIRALNIAKNLLDIGIHAPTIYFPLIVPEAIMIEPTETEPLEAIDELIDGIKAASALAYSNPEEALKAPLNTTIGKLDEAKAAHPKTICLSWRRLCQLFDEP